MRQHAECRGRVATGAKMEVSSYSDLLNYKCLGQASAAEYEATR